MLLARIAVAGEYQIGHVTFFETLRTAVAAREDIDAWWFPLVYERPSGWRGLPVVRAALSNWTIQSSLRSRALLRPLLDELDAVLLHTQTVGLFAPSIARRVPVWISTDATPANIDEVGVAYGHHVGRPLVERAKQAATGRAFRKALGVIVWSEWVRQSLIRTYGVDPRRITVIPPGVRIPPARVWGPGDDARAVRLLFVGGDFERKGGAVLLEALAGLEGCELDVVTRSTMVDNSLVRVHRGITPRSPELDRLYARADVAVLPTTGDASPIALLEGMAAGCPVVGCSVGAIPELIEDGVNGFMVPPGDPIALRDVLAKLIADPTGRRQMGERARARAVERYDELRNANRLLDLVLSTAKHRTGAPAAA